MGITNTQSSITNGENPPLTPLSKEVGKEVAESRIYEVGYLILPTVTEEALPREVTALKDVLERVKAAVISEEFPKFKALSYPMEKRLPDGSLQRFANAYFGWVKFEVQAEGIKKIEEEFKRNANVLRFLLIKTVRESTLSFGRPPRTERPVRKEVPKDAPASAPVSEAELDKSIEKLIAE